MRVTKLPRPAPWAAARYRNNLTALNIQDQYPKSLRVHTGQALLGPLPVHRQLIKRCELPVPHPSRSKHLLYRKLPPETRVLAYTRKDLLEPIVADKPRPLNNIGEILTRQLPKIKHPHNLINLHTTPPLHSPIRPYPALHKLKPLLREDSPRHPSFPLARLKEPLRCFYPKTTKRHLLYHTKPLAHHLQAPSNNVTLVTHTNRHLS
mmetsp:Transcript_31179/g.75236  ORF Transcript_31179/g.75236 Transcript_31179/m.75236 type:complete len:207 (+) Transcript_31179:821-1441(+)